MTDFVQSGGEILALIASPRPMVAVTCAQDGVCQGKENFVKGTV
jgi:hypothetical protein